MSKQTPQKKSNATGESISVSPVMRAMQIIEDKIAAGKLVPGQRLIEADLSEETGIARGRVREALRILAGSGIVELTPFKGARIKQLDQKEVNAMFKTISGLYCTAIVSLSFVYPTLKASDKKKFQVASTNLAKAARSGTLDDLIVANGEYLATTNGLCDNHHIEELMSELHMSLFYKHYADFVPESLIRNSMEKAEDVHETVVSGNPTKTVAIVWKTIEPIVIHFMSNGNVTKLKRTR